MSEVFTVHDEPGDAVHFDWIDIPVPVCAKQCLLDRETGYSHRPCYRTKGSCCPNTKPDGVSHFRIWDCVWRSCENDPGQAQKTVEIFMRECASKGLAISPEFTLSIPSTVAGDHFPAQYQHKDFVTPAEITPISGLYGGGTLLAWVIALIAATLSGIRPSSKRPKRKASPPTSRYLKWLYRCVGYMRGDAELIIALALPCVAAWDIKLRWQRADYFQIFGYANPSFVPASDGDDLVPDILTIRAAVVIVNHFLISAPSMIICPLCVALLQPKLEPTSLVRHVVRTLLILVTMIWCVMVTKPLFCRQSPLGCSSGAQGCWLANTYVGLGASMSEFIPVVTCVSGTSSVCSLQGGVVGFCCFVAALYMGTMENPGEQRPTVTILLVVSLFFYLFFIAYPFMVMGIFFAVLSIGALYMPFWYLTAQGRQCSFGPSSMIAFSDLDQVFALVIGACTGLTSIWESVVEYRNAVRGDAVLPFGNVETAETLPRES